MKIDNAAANIDPSRRTYLGHVVMQMDLSGGFQQNVFQTDPVMVAVRFVNIWSNKKEGIL